MDEPGGVREPGPHEDTAIIPATTAAAGPADPVIGQSWFDDRLRDFVEAIAIDSSGHPRPTEARQALAAASHDLIDRIANQAPRDAPPPDWPREAILQPHQLLANTFVVRSLIASGGVGQIYRVRHRDLRSDHAVKILLPRHMLDPTLTAMLMTEARLLCAIRHRGVVSCSGLLRDGDGRLLVVMEHVRGSTLSARLAQAPLSPGDGAALAAALLHALAAMHAAGVVHNDIAPDNVMLRDDSASDPVLIDFGLARPTDPAVAPETQDVTTDFAGKFSWVSPEQLQGPAMRPDARSDLYSLGLVLAASCGQRLPMGTDQATAIQARRSLPPPDGMPDPLEPLLRAVLHPDPADRPQTAEAALGFLDMRPTASMLRRLSQSWARRRHKP